MSTWALVMAAGMGQRMGLGHNKVLAQVDGKPVLFRSVHAFDGLADGVMVVARPDEMELIGTLLPGVPLAAGGDTRQRSVLNGLRALPADADIVLVHDGARPFVDEATIRRCIESVHAHGSGVASVPVKDTIKLMRNGTDQVEQTPDRARLRAAQTPQAFYKAELLAAIESLEHKGITATDDAAAMELAGKDVFMVDGSYENTKLTTPDDLKKAGQAGPAFRVGHGFDVHRLLKGPKLILCGVEIPFEKGLWGHSDADVAVHALMDAMLGAAGLGDIGRHFPDKDPAYKGISSLALLEKVRGLLAQEGYSLMNADLTIIAEQPKLAPYAKEMTERVAGALGVTNGQINVKATTTEGLGFEGEGFGISAHAVVSIYRNT